MKDIKKAKVFGAIAIIFFVIFLILMLCVALFSGTVVRADDTIGMMLVHLSNILFFLSIILCPIFTILAIYMYFRHSKKTAPINNAIKVLYERYAKGEITKEELEKMKKEIEG